LDLEYKYKRKLRMPMASNHLLQNPGSMDAIHGSERNFYVEFLNILAPYVWENGMKPFSLDNLWCTNMTLGHVRNFYTFSS
jgi:hypothetical protein